jgi:hypothetical protein
MIVSLGVFDAAGLSRSLVRIAGSRLAGQPLAFTATVVAAF